MSVSVATAKQTDYQRRDKLAQEISSKVCELQRDITRCAEHQGVLRAKDIETEYRERAVTAGFHERLGCFAEFRSKGAARTSVCITQMTHMGCFVLEVNGNRLLSTYAVEPLTKASVEILEAAKGAIEFADAALNHWMETTGQAISESRKQTRKTAEANKERTDQASLTVLQALVPPAVTRAAR